MTDESFARDLLLKHYHDRMPSIAPLTNDPPDLVITWPDRSTWGVEVTRTYQMVEEIGSGRIVPTSKVGDAMDALWKEIRDATHGQRRMSYNLSLWAPGLFRIWKQPDAFKQWHAETKSAVLAHIASGSHEELRLDGARLMPCGEGNRFNGNWSAGGGSLPDLETATMLSRAMLGKQKKLANWSQPCDRRWLFLINKYPLADDDEESITAICDAAAAERISFDGIFWCPCRGDSQEHLPRVIPMPLTTP